MSSFISKQKCNLGVKRAVLPVQTLQVTSKKIDNLAMLQDFFKAASKSLKKVAKERDSILKEQISIEEPPNQRNGNEVSCQIDKASCDHFTSREGLSLTASHQGELNFNASISLKKEKSGNAKRIFSKAASPQGKRPWPAKDESPIKFSLPIPKNHFDKRRSS
jgi:hypothetical protein